MGLLQINVLRSLSNIKKIKYFTTNFNASCMSLDESYVLKSLIENLQNEMSFTENSIDRLSAVLYRNYEELDHARRAS